MSKSLLIIVGLFIILFTSACSSSKLPPMPDIGAQVDEFNTDFKLSVPEGWNTYKVNEPVILRIEVLGNESISFSYDAFNNRKDINLFVLEENKWVEIENLAKYPEGFLVYMPANTDPLKYGVVSIFPILKDIDQTVLLRIVLTGYFFENNQITNKQSISYIDVPLNP